jgi:hypothetical protein
VLAFDGRGVAPLFFYVQELIDGPQSTHGALARGAAEPDIRVFAVSEHDAIAGRSIGSLALENLRVVEVGELRPGPAVGQHECQIVNRYEVVVAVEPDLSASQAYASDDQVIVALLNSQQDVHSIRPFNYNDLMVWYCN